jgi:hypothetical protein
MVRCRTGIFANSAFETIPDLRRTAIALHRVPEKLRVSDLVLAARRHRATPFK